VVKAQQCVCVCVLVGSAGMRLVQGRGVRPEGCVAAGPASMVSGGSGPVQRRCPRLEVAGKR
jgi:hypothetical protein